jgi:hypothetical protein
MLRDALAWVLYSPRRLLAVAATVAALAVLATVGVNADDPTPSRAESTNTTPVQPTPARPEDDRHLQHTEHTEHTERTAPARLIRRTALRFVDAYVVAPGAHQPRVVPPSLRAMSAPALWRGLRLTDPDTLPRGSVRRVSVEAAGPFSGTVTVELDTGPELALSVVAWERGWRVSDVRPVQTP